MRKVLTSVLQCGSLVVALRNMSLEISALVEQFVEVSGSK